MIDSHAHVGFSRFDEDREAVVARAKKAGVKGWIEVGTDLETSRAAIALTEMYEGVGAAVGVHPTEVVNEGLINSGAGSNGSRLIPSPRGRNVFPDSWGQILSLLVEKNVVAIGEVGLDFYRGGSLDGQMRVLHRFVEIGVQRDLPLVFHLRSGDDVDAHEILLEYLEGLSKKKRPRGVMHTFSGNVEQAERFLAMGFYLGFSGVITFKNAGMAIEVVKNAPINRMLIETDCPFLAPEPWRGKRNEPAYVKYVAEKMAVIKEMSFEEVAEVTEQNTRLLFGM